MQPTEVRVSGGIRHHLPDATLLAHATGAASAGLSLLVACHLTLCAACRERVAELDRVGAVFWEQLDPVATHEHALSATLSRLDEPRSPQPGTPAGRALPAPLRRLVGSLDSVRWTFQLPGIWKRSIDLPGQPNLFWLAPRLRIPQHDHRGDERLLVLEGSYHDGGDVLRRGDLSYRRPGQGHSPVIGDEEPCIALVVADGPLEVEPWWGRLLARFVEL